MFKAKVWYASRFGSEFNPPWIKTKYFSFNKVHLLQKPQKMYYRQKDINCLICTTALSKKYSSRKHLFVDFFAIDTREMPYSYIGTFNAELNNTIGVQVEKSDKSTLRSYLHFFPLHELFPLVGRHHGPGPLGRVHATENRFGRRITENWFLRSVDDTLI